MKIEVSHFGAALTIGLLEKHIQEVKDTEWVNGLMSKEWYLSHVESTLDALNDACAKVDAANKKRFNR